MYMQYRRKLSCADNDLFSQSQTIIEETNSWRRLCNGELKCPGTVIYSQKIWMMMIFFCFFLRGQQEGDSGAENAWNMKMKEWMWRFLSVAEVNRSDIHFSYVSLLNFIDNNKIERKICFKKLNEYFFGVEPIIIFHI